MGIAKRAIHNRVKNVSSNDKINVSSHVARDFLQNSDYFSTPQKVLWEYISNSIDAAQEGIPLVVVVTITSTRIEIIDNGRGMSRSDLKNFFRMHGENKLRTSGKRVRGRFGTGKAAAFGIANSLTIDTVQNNLRNEVSLHRRDIVNAKDGQAFPVLDRIVNEKTEESNGTKVTIQELKIKRQDTNKITQYIEKHLNRYRLRVKVIINDHECQYHEMPFIEEFKFPCPDDLTDDLGEVLLTIKVSPTPLDEETNGIDVLSHGIWHATTLAGIERREKANLLFGEIDVPALEDKEWEIAPFDNTRSNTLNIQSYVVIALYSWIADELEKVRTFIVEKDRERRKSEEAKQLAKEAQRIAEILNEDFQQQEMELQLARQVARRSGDINVSEVLSEEGQLTPGGGTTASPWQETGAPHGNGKRSTLAGDGDFPRPRPNLRTGNEQGSPKDVSQGKEKKRRGIFSIDYENATINGYRSRYDSQSKTIFINLDHPQIARAFRVANGKADDPQFRIACYEIAAVEYALAIPFEKIEADELNDPADALYEVKETINRITRKLMAII
jgi:hypothetical protein